MNTLLNKSSHCNRQSVHLEKAKGHLEVVLGV